MTFEKRGDKVTRGSDGGTSNMHEYTVWGQNQLYALALATATILVDTPKVARYKRHAYRHAKESAQCSRA